MLHINDLTYRIEGKPILERATAAIPSGHKVGLVGRNGAGKTTLLRLLKGEVSPDDGAISIPRNARIGHVAQEAPGGDDSLIDWVLSADTERASLLAEAEHATDPHLQAFIDRFKAKASKAAQAQSRVKALAKLQPIAAQVDDRVVPFHFPDPQKTIASPLLRLEAASAGYTAEQPVLGGLDLRIDNDDRIALLGQNGNGKSTVAKLIAGKLKPLSGPCVRSAEGRCRLFRPASARRSQPRCHTLRLHAEADA